MDLQAVTANLERHWRHKCRPQRESCRRPTIRAFRLQRAKHPGYELTMESRGHDTFKLNVSFFFFLFIENAPTTLAQKHRSRQVCSSRLKITYPDQAYLASPNQDVSLEPEYSGVTTTSLPLTWHVLQTKTQFSNWCWYL